MKEAQKAAFEGRFSDLKKLYQSDAMSVHRYDDDHRTCLHWSASGGSTEIANWLIDFCSVNINVEDDAGWTPLHIACSAGRTEIVEKLVNSGASVNKQNNNGCTPLHYAASKGHPRIVEILLDHGAFIDTVDEQAKETPLHKAAAKGALGCVKILVSRGACINFSDGYGDPPIVRAIESDEQEIIKFLISSGATISSKNKEGVYVYELIPNKFKETLKAENLYNIS